MLRISEKGAYSNVLLPVVTRVLAAVDRAFVYRLVTDALRNSRRVDQVIAAASPRGIEGLDPEVLAILRIAVSEFVSGGTAGVYATVNESVDAVRQLGRPRAAGFVNAVLRKLASGGLPSTAESPAVTFAVPDWMFEALCDAHGQLEATRMLAGLRDSPATPLRIRPGGRPP